MASQQENIAKLLAQVQESGASYLRDNGSDKNDLLHKISLLQREVEGPAALLDRTCLAPLLNICQLMAMETGLLIAIVKRKGQSADTRTLANETQREEILIVRIMRLLTAHGICEETGVRQYRSNAAAELLNSPGHRGRIRDLVDLIFPTGGKIVPFLRETATTGSQTNNPLYPFKYAHGMSLFEYYELSAEHKEAFDNFMSDRRASIPREWFDLYPVESQLLPGCDQSGESVFLVDVSGGRGHDISSLKTHFPHLPGRLVLQDLPRTFKDLKLDGIELMPRDLFTEQPIKGARAYFFRGVLHDWSDAHSRDILTHITRAMKPGYSKLIIEDQVLADKGAGMRESTYDVIMYMMLGGIERSMNGWEELLDSVGLQILKVWSSKSGGESVIEAELKAPA